MRACRECGKKQPVEEFPLSGTVKGVRYYRHLCVQCYSKQKTKKSNDRMVQFREYKKTLKCNRCGYDDHRALEFHHPNDDKDRFNPCVIARMRSWENVLKEINKCEVLCSNCHRIEHYTGH